MSPILLLALSVQAHAWPASSEWVPLSQAGADLVDVRGDKVGGAASDLVGVAGAPAGYWSTDGVTLFLRMRVDDTPWSSGAMITLRQGSWGVVFDTDGDLTTFEYAIGLTGATPQVFLLSNTSGAAGASASMTIEEFYSITHPFDEVARISTAPTTLGSDDDYYVDLAIETTDLADEFGLLTTTPFRVALVTSQFTGLSTFDSDMAGASGNDLGLGWTDGLAIDQDGDGLTDSEELIEGTSRTDADTDDDGLSDLDEVDGDTDPLLCDTDGDDLPDGLELGVAAPVTGTDLTTGCFRADTHPASTTDPTLPDTDTGGVRDGDEDWNRNGAIDTWEIDPDLVTDDVDTDGDGIWDALETRCTLDGGAIDDVDSDGDGIPDADEWLGDPDDDGLASFCDGDSDGDGIPDSVEGDGDTDGDDIPDYLDPDSDGDGVDDAVEGTDDTDGDGIPDYVDDDDTDGPLGDPDGDGLTNAEEADCATDPLVADTDGDGIVDGDEGSCDADTDCDGTPDVLDATYRDRCDPLLGGQFTGGSCDAGGGAPLGLGVLLGLVALLRRRAPLALALLPGTALAQSGPRLDAQTFRPAIDGQRWFALTDTVVGPKYTLGATVLGNLSHDPLVYRYDDGRDDFVVVGSLATANVTGWLNLPRVRVGVDLPLHVVSQGYEVEGFRLIGDLRVGAAVEIVERAGDGFGLAALAHVDLPTGNEDAWLGEARTTAGGGVAGAYETGGLVLAANVGVRTGTGQTLSDLKWGPRLDYRLGLSQEVLDGLSLGAELGGGWVVGRSQPGATPLEALGGVQVRPWRSLVIRAGAGAGLSQGIGSPDYRVLVGLGWQPAHDDGVGLFASDRDGDRIADDVDACPDQPEDYNGVDDADGCPDGDLTPTRLRVIDGRGRAVAGAEIGLDTGPATGSYTLLEGELTRSLPAGSYTLRVSAKGYTPKEEQLDVPKARRHEHVVTIDKISEPGRIVVTATDEQGLAIPSRVRFVGHDRIEECGVDGVCDLSAPAGAYDLVVSAEGYGRAEKSVTLTEGGRATFEVVLRSARVKVAQDQVLILDKVFFELDSDVIRRESFPLLDEVVETLFNHPELARIEIQGHTDDQGTDAYNLDLSKRRAEAVRTYLVQSGIDAARLTSQGYGEAKPLVTGITEEARASNRRVEFHVIERK